MSDALAPSVLAGDARAIARAISLVEDEAPGGSDLIRAIFAKTGRAYVVGVTGPPGAGKSTLVDRLTANFRQSGQTVGILAVDPTSPFTGGAVLGDRLRMHGHALDEHVFIRSMATRGHLGGLAAATADAALILDAAGKDIVIIETVGVGQDEVDITRTSDISVVVLVPGAGDDIQALKAGLMEIADVFVVNKADREGSDRLIASIEATLSLHSYAPDEWRPPIVRTVATSGQGTDGLVAEMARFRARAGLAERDRRRVRAEQRLRDCLSRAVIDHIEHRLLSPADLSTLVDRIASRDLDPYTAADEVLRRVGFQIPAAAAVGRPANS